MTSSFVENDPIHMCITTARSGHTILDMRMFSCSDGERAVLCNIAEEPIGQKRVSGPVSLSVDGNMYSIFTTELAHSTTVSGQDAHFFVTTADVTTRNCTQDTIDVQRSQEEDPIIFASLVRTQLRDVTDAHVIRQTTIRHSSTSVSSQTCTHIAVTDKKTGDWDGIIARQKVSTKKLRAPPDPLSYVPFDFAESGKKCPKMNYALINLKNPGLSILSKNGSLAGGSLTTYKISDDELDDFAARVHVQKIFSTYETTGLSRILLTLFLSSFRPMEYSR